MSNLLTTEEGRNALIEAQKYLLRRRLSRFFKRNLVVNFNQYLAGGQFNIQGLLGQLNQINDPEIIELYRLLGIVGGLETTIAPMTFYVQNTGSDITGDGSITNPYASLWFLNHLPRKIAHPIIVYIQSDITDNNSYCLDQTITTNQGAIHIAGTGPYTVLDTNLIVAVQNYQARYVLTTGLSLVDSYNSFVRFRNGPLANFVLPALKALGSIGTYETPIVLGASPNIGNTFDIIKPGYTLTLNGLTVDLRGETLPANLGIQPQNNRFTIQNLTIKNSVPGPNLPRFTIAGNSALEFVSIEVTAPFSQWKFTGQLNGQAVANLSGLTFANYGSSANQIGAYISQDSASASHVPAVCSISNNVNIKSFAIRSDMKLDGITELGSVSDATFNKVHFLGDLQIKNCCGKFLSCNFPDNPPQRIPISNSRLTFASITTSSKLILWAFDISNSEIIIQNWDDLSDIEALPANQRGGLLINALGRIVLNGTIPVNPNADAIKFTAFAVAVDHLWPAVDGSRTASTSIVYRTTTI